MFTQSLHFRRCSILPLLCLGVSSPQYIQAFSLLIARDLIELLEDGELDTFKMFLFALIAEVFLIVGDLTGSVV